MSSNTSENEVFEYMGNGRRAPEDVVRVVFHPSVVKVDSDVFCRCRKLKEIVLNEGLKKLENQVLFGCESLEHITLSSTVTDIGEDAFYNCNSLREVVLNEGLVNVGKYAFNNCTSLESITLPSTVIEISKGAFYNCKSLRAIVLNEGLQKIGRSAFANCRSLESITLPSSVVEIGDYAFHSCKNLRGIVCSETLPMIYYNTFDECPTLERITFLSLSSRVYDMIGAGQFGIQDKIQQYMNRGVIEWRRGGTIQISPVEVAWFSRIRRGDGWGIVKEHLRRIVNWIKYYEMKEATTLFELALWKAEIDQVDEADPRDQDACRVDVPGPVKDIILQYLDLELITHSIVLD